MDAKLLVRVVSWREKKRPVNWIAREEGLDTEDVRAILRIAGDPSWNATEIRLDKYDQIEYLVNQRASVTDIMRTTGCDSRTIKKWFDYSGWQRGSEERKDALGLARQMRDIERREML